MVLFKRKKNKFRIKLKTVTTPNQDGMSTGVGCFSQTYRVDTTKFTRQMSLTIEPGLKQESGTQSTMYPPTAVLKVYDACYFPDGYLVPRHADELHHKELSAYRTLSSLQGTSIPRLYGSGKLEDRELNVQGLFLLIEDIGVDRVDMSNWVDYSGAKETLVEIHNLGIAHGDIRLDNMGKRRPTGQVVFWDFGSAVHLETCEYSYQVKRTDLRRLHRLSVSSLKSNSISTGSGS